LTRYLLDTNIVSDLIKNPQGKAAKRIARAGEGQQIELTSRRRSQNQPPALRRNTNIASTRFLTLDFRMMLVM